MCTCMECNLKVKWSKSSLFDCYQCQFLHQENRADANALVSTSKTYVSDIATEYVSDRLCRGLGKSSCTVEYPSFSLKASYKKTFMCRNKATYIYVMPPCLRLTRP
mmetsp:Transcript_5749/g.35742  ORF Transcript_5749/g.35742 Transcript_5749/m.35742 type:complete len:106 (+) Transcript_5749:970-1287(+)